MGNTASAGFRLPMLLMLPLVVAAGCGGKEDSSTVPRGKQAASASTPATSPEPHAPADPVSPQTVLRISRETTYITEPLDEEGFVDYLEAINRRTSQGATPANNLEIVIRQIMGPGSIHTDMRREYFQRLGIPVPSTRGSYYVTFPDYIKQLDLTADEQDRLTSVYSLIQLQPWGSAECPQASRWLRSVNGHLDRLVEGSQRATYYTPYVRNGTESQHWPAEMGSISLPSPQDLRRLCTDLCIRAMNRIAQRELEEAWSDLQAIHRLSRHVSSGFCVIELVVSTSLGSMAWKGDREVLRSVALTDRMARQFLMDLNRLAALPAVSEKFDSGERYTLLDAAQSVARQQPGSLEFLLDLFGEATDPGVDSGIQDAAAADDMQVDWNAAMALINQWYSRGTVIAETADYTSRRILLKQFRADIIDAKIDPREYARKLRQEANSENISRLLGLFVGNSLVHLMFPSVYQALLIEHQAHGRLALLRLGFAVELYRREQGQYPNALKDLVPEYVEQIPLDPLSGKPLHYFHRESGFLLYGMGLNAIDDAGRSNRDCITGKEGWDDDVIRVGLPPQSE